MALINSRVQTVFNVLGGFNSPLGGYNDQIIANNQLESTGSGGGNWIGRFQNSRRMLFVRNNGIYNQYYGHAWRYHGANNNQTVSDLYFADNLIYGPCGPMIISSSGSAAAPSDTLDNIWIVDNELHTTQVFDSAFVQTQAPSFTTNMTITGNSFFGNAANVTSFGNVEPSWTVSGNTLSPPGS